MKITNIDACVARKLGFTRRTMKRTRLAAGAAVIAGGVMLSAANGQTIYSENFDGLTLGPLVSSSEGGGDGTDWTADPPAGWTKDNTTTPTDGPAEFFGFTFFDKEAWIETAGNQSRDTFTRGSGTVAVVDPDEYDDLGEIDPDLMNVFLMTPEISLDGVEENSLELAFDSSFRPYPTMVGTVDVSFDGGSNWDNLLTLNDATVEGGTSSLSRADSHEVLPLSNPAGGSAMVRFGLTDAGNDWWWAIDNVAVSVVPEPGAGLLAWIAFGWAALCGRKRRS